MKFAMILNDIDYEKHGQRLISRRLLFAEEAYISNVTGEVFIPLVDDVILDIRSGRMYRKLSNAYNNVNIKLLHREYKHLKTDTWDFLDRIDPITRMYIPEINSRRIIRRKKGMYCKSTI